MDWAQVREAFFAPGPDLTGPLQAVAIQARRGAAGKVVSDGEGGDRGSPTSRVIFGHPADPNRWGWLSFGEPVLHPLALERWAAILGVPAAALQRLVDSEAFVEAGRIHAWPWYPEQKGEIEAEQGLLPPPRFLDDPYEAAHYHRRSGEHALFDLLRQHGVPHPEQAKLDGIPVAPLTERLPQPGLGGTEIAHSDTWNARRLNQVAYSFEHVVGDDRAILVRYQTEALADRFGRGQPRRELDERPHHELPDDFEPKGAAYTNLVLDEGHTYLKTPGALCRDGAWSPLPGELVWVRQHLVCVEIWGWRYVFDQRDGSLRTDRWDALLAEVGAQDQLLPDRRYQMTCPLDELDASGRYALGWPYIFKICDSSPVAPQFEAWEHEPDDEDEEEPRPGPALLDPGPPPGARVVEFDGLRFTLRGGSAPAVDSAWTRSFALGPDGWRAVQGRSFFVGDVEIARFAEPIAMAALSADGTEVAVVAGGRLHHLVWDDRPVLESSIPLESAP